MWQVFFPLDLLVVSQWMDHQKSISLWLRGKGLASVRKHNRTWERRGVYGSPLFQFTCLTSGCPCKSENAKNTNYGYSCKIRCQVPRSWGSQDDLRWFNWWFSVLAIFILTSDFELNLNVKCNFALNQWVPGMSSKGLESDSLGFDSELFKCQACAP